MLYIQSNAMIKSLKSLDGCTFYEVETLMKLTVVRSIQRFAQFFISYEVRFGRKRGNMCWCVFGDQAQYLHIIKVDYYAYVDRMCT